MAMLLSVIFLIASYNVSNGASAQQVTNATIASPVTASASSETSISWKTATVTATRYLDNEMEAPSSILTSTGEALHFLLLLDVDLDIDAGDIITETSVITISVTTDCGCTRPPGKTSNITTAVPSPNTPTPSPGGSCLGASTTTASVTVALPEITFTLTITATPTTVTITDTATKTLPDIIATVTDTVTSTFVSDIKMTVTETRTITDVPPPITVSDTITRSGNASIIATTAIDSSTMTMTGISMTTPISVSTEPGLTVMMTVTRTVDRSKPVPIETDTLTKLISNVTKTILRTEVESTIFRTITQSEPQDTATHPPSTIVITETWTFPTTVRITETGSASVATITETISGKMSVITSTVVETITATKTVSEPYTVTIDHSKSVGISRTQTSSGQYHSTTILTTMDNTQTQTNIMTSKPSVTVCPTRIVNPTYTPSVLLPENYTWGCPPGNLCHPPQDDCNFEAGPPANTYYCSPNECIPSPNLLLPQSWGPNVTSDQVGHFNVSPGYFNLMPSEFNLTIGIFDFPLGVQLANTVQRIGRGVSSTTLNRAHEFDNPNSWQALHSGVEHAIPGVCYDECNNCMLEAEAKGKVPALCAANSAFEIFLGFCNSCISMHRHRGSDASTPPEFQQFLSYCDTINPSPSGGSSPPPVASSVLADKTVPASDSGGLTPTGGHDSSEPSLSAAVPYPSVTTLTEISEPITSGKDPEQNRKSKPSSGTVSAAEATQRGGATKLTDGTGTASKPEDGTQTTKSDATPNTVVPITDRSNSSKPAGTSEADPTAQSTSTDLSLPFFGGATDGIRHLAVVFKRMGIMWSVVGLLGFLV